MSLGVGEGAIVHFWQQDKEYRWPLEAGKSKDTNFPLGPPERMQSCQSILDFFVRLGKRGLYWSQCIGPGVHLLATLPVSSSGALLLLEAPNWPSLSALLAGPYNSCLRSQRKLSTVLFFHGPLFSLFNVWRTNMQIFRWQLELFFSLTCICWREENVSLINPGRMLKRTQHFKKSVSALAGVAQWTECQPANQGVASLFPSLGHKPGLQARSPVGGMQEATTHWCFSPSLSPL